MQTRAIRIAQPGGPEAMHLETIDLAAPGPNEVLLRHTAIGVNFIDVYQRTGLYPLPLPMGNGTEGAGVVEAIGPGVTLWKVGDRVAYAGGTPGSYCERRLFPADRLVAIPAGVTDEVAAASMLKGMTVEYLLDRCVHLKAGDYALMYAAAGGIGLFAGQWARHRGIHLIGVAAGADKVALAMAHGYHTVLDRRTDDIVARVKEITGGRMLPVVFDSVGKDTFTQSLNLLAPRGIFVTFGNTSGLLPPFDVGELAKRGSLYVTRPSLGNYVATRDDLLKSAGTVLGFLGDGTLTAQIGQRYKLEEAAQVHRDLEAGRTTGSTVMVP